MIDPTEGEGIEERVRSLGEPAAVLQLLDRHNRDCAAFAERLGVPHQRVPFEPVGPFETVAVVRRKRWQEGPLWWPERRRRAAHDEQPREPGRTRSEPSRTTSPWAASSSASIRSCG